MSKTVLITGASSGIGKATAELFARKGWNVVATMRSHEDFPALTETENLRVLQLDVTDPQSVRDAVEKTLELFGKIDVVVNNAGYGLVGPFEAATPEQIDRQFKTNVEGIFSVTRTVLPYFRERKEGLFINITSMGGQLTFPLYSLYHATKWAVEGFTESLQYELNPLGIRVKLVEPGPIKTSFYSTSMDLVAREGLTAYEETIAKAMPNLQKAGATGATPESVAHVIYKAATDRSNRLRYAAKASHILTARKLLPDAAVFALVRFNVFR